MDLAGGVVEKEIRSGVFGNEPPDNPNEKGAHPRWQGHDCRDLTAGQQLRDSGVASKGQGEESVLASLIEV